MPEATALGEVLLGLGRALHVEYDIDAVLANVADNVTTLLQLQGAAVSVATSRSVRHVTSNCAALVALCTVEDRAQRGPTIDAVESGTPVVLASLVDGTVPWPEYVAEATASGLGAIAAVPANGHTPQVALTLGHLGDHDWTAHELQVAGMFARIAGHFVLSGSQLVRHRVTAEQLQAALDSRVIIEQAKGFVADNRGVTVDEAFVILRKYANDHHATLRSVSDAVVNLGLRP